VHVSGSDVVSWSGAAAAGNGPAVEGGCGGSGGSGQDVNTSCDLGCASIGSSPPPPAAATYPWIKVGHQVEAFTEGVYASVHVPTLSAVV
jgi:hypothetical protein